MRRPDEHLRLLTDALADVCGGRAPAGVRRKFRSAKRVEVAFAIEGVGIQFLFRFARAPWSTARASYLGDGILWE